MVGQWVKWGDFHGVACEAMKCARRIVAQATIM